MSTSRDQQRAGNGLVQTGRSGEAVAERLPRLTPSISVTLDGQPLHKERPKDDVMFQERVHEHETRFGGISKDGATTTATARPAEK